MHNNSHIDYTYDTSIRQSKGPKRVQTNKDEVYLSNNFKGS